ncbi:MAG: tetratricopeptide repeat protein [Persicimonas sp.]
MNDHKQRAEESEQQARDELRRAYLLVGFGKFDEAIEACERASKLAPDHHLPVTLEGSFLLASGRMQEALAKLRAATRSHPDRALPWIYFAEACFLSGRHRQGGRALDTARQTAQSDEHRRLIDQLDELWQQVEPEEVPPPLEVASTA